LPGGFQHFRNVGPHQAEEGSFGEVPVAFPVVGQPSDMPWFVNAALAFRVRLLGQRAPYTVHRCTHLTLILIAQGKYQDAETVGLQAARWPGSTGEEPSHERDRVAERAHLLLEAVELDILVCGKSLAGMETARALLVKAIYRLENSR
jgi:hypothetical protein